jgi:hypothetical protein
MSKKKPKRRARPIVAGFLEKVSAKIFDKYQKEITDMTKGHQGLYALYRKNKLYYLGLASNLKNRIRHHLKDRHQGKWTHFSLYIIRKSDHIKELESLVLRISYPEGNKMMGKLRSSKNILPVLKKQVKDKIKAEFEDIFKSHKILIRRTNIKSVKEKPLKGLLRDYQRIYANYKGKKYRAKVLPNGTLKMIPDGQLFDSPSGAAKAIITKGAVNGWSFWKYKDKNGNLVKIANIRK